MPGRVAETGASATKPRFVDDVFITDELERRKPAKTDYRQEKLALQDLASQMVDSPSDVLPHLVDLAIDICRGTSGGISLLEERPSPGVFRWHHLRGDLTRFVGNTTPREFSPCGVTLDLTQPVLCQRPERMYTWLADAGISLAEVLLVPLYVGASAPQGTLWIVAAGEGHFDSGHARVMTELAAFAGIALRMLGTEQRLNQALKQQQLLTEEMSHRTKNLFAVASGMIRVSARSASTPEEMSSILSGRLDALSAAHELALRSFRSDGAGAKGTNLGDLVRTILRPYISSGAVRLTIEGAPTPLGDRSTRGLALLLHEFATNAVKYGALIDAGAVAISWRSSDGRLLLKWLEEGGPRIEQPPARTGFGTRLIRNTVVDQLGGTLDYEWRTRGLAVAISVPIEKLED